jgi:nucleoside-diphosphate-sugar epimerase
VSLSPDRIRRVLLIGCGDLGSRIANRLVDSGATVSTLTRRPPACANTFALIGDVTEPGSLPELPQSYDWVIYCLTPGARDEASYRRVYVDGLKNVIAGLAAVQPSRFCFVSSTAVYGATTAEWVDETTECQPEAFNGRVLREAERIVQKIAGGLVLRLGGIYGPGRDSLLRAAIEQRPLSASIRGFGNRIHVDDAAAACVHLTALSAEGVFNIVDNAPAPAAEVMGYLANRLQLPAVPDPGSYPVQSGRRVANAKLRATGFTFLHPDFRSGYDALIAGRGA